MYVYIYILYIYYIYICIYIIYIAHIYYIYIYIYIYIIYIKTIRRFIKKIFQLLPLSIYINICNCFLFYVTLFKIARL